jgi:hypothetical protein
MARRADVSDQKFLNALHMQGKQQVANLPNCDNTAISSMLGMALGSFQTRKSVTIAKLAKKGYVWPYPLKRGRRAGASLVDANTLAEAKAAREVMDKLAGFESTPDDESTGLGN